MSFRVVIPRPVERRIQQWRLPDHLLVEVYLRLRDDLSHQPFEKMRRTRKPFDGMEYRFQIIDPANRLNEYLFAFHILFTPDEQSLLVARATCVQSFGL